MVISEKSESLYSTPAHELAPDTFALSIHWQGYTLQLILYSEDIFWEVENLSSSHQFPRIWRNPKDHYRIEKRSYLPKQTNPMHIQTTQYLTL